MKKLVSAAVAVFSAAVFAETGAAVESSDAGENIIDLVDKADGTVEVTAGSGGDLINVVCEDATVSEVLRQFRKMVRANIISSDSTNMSRRVSISLYDTPWLDSLRAVIGLGGFILDERGGIYFVTEEQADDPVVRAKSFTLNHASAEDLATLLNESFGEKDPKTGKVVNGVATVFKDSNVVVVNGTDKLIRDCEDVIKAVDQAPAQVYIEARFMSLSAEAMHKLGVQWNQLSDWGATVKGMNAGYEQNSGSAANYGTKLTQRTTNSNINQTDSHSTSEQPGSATVIDGTPVTMDGGTSVSDNINNNRTVSDNGTYTTLTPSAIAAAIGAGRTAEQMGWGTAGGFSGQLSVDDFRLAISAFEQFGEGKLFSNPRIIVSNGKEAKVDMTTKHPNVTVTAHRSDGVNSSLDLSTRIEVIPGEDKEMFAKEAFFSWGISLSVKPRISPDGLINVEIIPTISDLNGWTHVEGVNTDNSSTPYTKYPIIDVKRLTTDFTMKDGATAVIGGLSQTKEQDVDSGIPYLRKIPWIGPKLFGWKSREKVQNEIIVFVTVGIANPEALKKDVGLPKNAILGRDYVRGKKLEPGDRKGSAAEIMALDMRGLDDRKDDAEKDGAKPNAKKDDRRPAPRRPSKRDMKGPSKGDPVLEPAGPSKSARRK